MEPTRQVLKFVCFLRHICRKRETGFSRWFVLLASSLRSNNAGDWALWKDMTSDFSRDFDHSTICCSYFFQTSLSCFLWYLPWLLIHFCYFFFKLLWVSFPWAEGLWETTSLHPKLGVSAYILPLLGSTCGVTLGIFCMNKWKTTKSIYRSFDKETTYDLL